MFMGAFLSSYMSKVKLRLSVGEWIIQADGAGVLPVHLNIRPLDHRRQYKENGTCLCALSRIC